MPPRRRPLRRDSGSSPPSPEASTAAADDCVRIKQIPIPRPDKNDDLDNNSIGVLDVLRMLAGLVLLSCALSWAITRESFTWGYRPWWVRPEVILSWIHGPIALTDAQLAAYDGTDPTKPIYIGLNGTIYDVSSGGSAYYGPGGSYHFFAGRDAARAFITGCFDTDLTPDLRGVEEMFIPVDDPDEVISSGERKNRRALELRGARKKIRKTIEGWEKVFNGSTGKKYHRVGYVQREKGWLEKLPRRELCEKAQESRPKRKKQGEMAEKEAYRGPGANS